MRPIALPKSLLAGLAVATVAIAGAASGAEVTVQWTGTVASIDGSGITQGEPLGHDVEALIAIGDRAAYRLTVDDAIGPDDSFSDSFNFDRDFETAVLGFSLEVGNFSAGGSAGAVEYRVTRDTRGPAGVIDSRALHEKVIEEGSQLAGAGLDVFMSDRVIDDQLRSLDLSLGEALDFLQVRPEADDPDLTLMLLRLDRTQQDGSVSSEVAIEIVFDTSTISEVPLPPALALMLGALAVLGSCRRRSRGLRCKDAD